MELVSTTKIRSRISQRKIRRILRMFSVDVNAVQIAELTGINRNTVNRYLKIIRTVIAQYCEEQSPFSGVVEVDESYFGSRHVKGKRGRGASGKTIVFGIFKRNGKVYTRIVLDVTRASLQDVIKGKVTLDSVIHSDHWKAYNGLVDVGYMKHYRINHSIEYANSVTHINGIESFWSFAKTRLSKFRGMNKQTFYLHLKESEFRFNHRHENLYKLLLKLTHF